jgi:hypothetical protein
MTPTRGVQGPAARVDLFGPPPLIAGEDAAAYHELLTRIRAAIKPVDIIDEMFTNDVTVLEWEILRWRRLKLSLIRTRQLEALNGFLGENLGYELYSDFFADRLTEILPYYLPDHQEGVPHTKDLAHTLAHECARNEPSAEARVNKILARNSLDMDDILRDAKADKAKDLVQAYARRESDAVKLIHELLARAGTNMDALVAGVLPKNLDDIERIDRLTTIAESRRNASLREIDRRRALLGEKLRRNVQEIEDGEFKVIETTPAKGKKAA